MGPCVCSCTITEKAEGRHHAQLASYEQHWVAETEAQTEAAQKALDERLDEARARHSRELDTLERGLVDAKMRLMQTTHEAETAAEATKAERRELELILTELRQTIVKEEAALQEVQEVARKAQVPGVNDSHDECRAELMRVRAELKEELEHVADMEGELKEAKNKNVLLTSGQEVGAPATERAEGNSCENTAQLKEKLTLALLENEELKKMATRLAPSGPDIRRPDVGVFTDGAETKEERETHDHTEFAALRKALEEAEMRASELQQCHNRAEKVHLGSLVERYLEPLSNTSRANCRRCREVCATCCVAFRTARCDDVCACWRRTKEHLNIW